MKINSETPQSALELLYRAASRRELLKNSPLNLRITLCYALIFLLFPAMALGFWVGMGVTLAFSVGLICLLSMNHTAEAVLAVQLWLACGGCGFLVMMIVMLRSACAARRLRETPRPADPAPTPLPPPLPCAEAKKLRWRKTETANGARLWEAKLTFHAPVAGIHAFYISVPELGRRLFLTRGQQGVCTVHSTTSGGKLQALLLYKLSAGAHTLSWTLEPGSGRYAPHTELTLLCQPLPADHTPS